LKIDLPDPKLAGRNDNAVATQPVTSSSPVPCWAEVGRGPVPSWGR
jgi:hypothetical protein